MLTLRRAEDRGHANLGWLDSRHTFSFGDYHDPRFMGFGPLRVINDDRIAGGGGFAMHPHRDMEIVTYVLDGALEHKDSLGTGSVIRPGEVQSMSAGTGIRHSEFNASKTDPVHLLQIWLLPRERNLAPSYEQTAFDRRDLLGKLRLVASGDGREGSVHIAQDADLYASLPGDGGTLQHTLGSGRIAWLQVARGAAALNGTPLAAGDGVAIATAGPLEIAGRSADAEVLLFDMAGSA